MVSPYDPIGLIVVVLACWRISALLVREDGPYDMLAKLRRKMGVRYNQRSEMIADNVVGKLFTCVWCMSVWVAPFVAGLALLNLGKIVDFALIALAVSAAAIIVDTNARK